METATPQLLTYRQVADALGVHLNTVRRLVERGELPRVVIGGSVRVRASDLAALVEHSREQQA